MTCAKKKDRVAAASPKLRCMFDHTFVRQLADEQTAPVGEDHGRPALIIIGSHGSNVGTKIELAREVAMTATNSPTASPTPKMLRWWRGWQ